jgi:hypothetical protein
MVSEEMIDEDALIARIMAGAAMMTRRRKILPEVVRPRLSF